MPSALPLASTHFHRISVETQRCARLLPAVLTMSAAMPWP